MTRYSEQRIKYSRPSCSLPRKHTDIHLPALSHITFTVMQSPATCTFEMLTYMRDFRPVFSRVAYVHILETGTNFPRLVNVVDEAGLTSRVQLLYACHTVTHSHTHLSRRKGMSGKYRTVKLES